jgi:hypothetical protein
MLLGKLDMESIPGGDGRSSSVNDFQCARFLIDWFSIHRSMQVTQVRSGEDFDAKT